MISNKGEDIMYCKECGKLYEHENSSVCPNCGTKQGHGRKYCEKCGTKNEYEKHEVCKTCGTYFLNSKKTKLVSVLLLLLLGIFGAHQFYVGNKGTGIMYIFLIVAAFFTSGTTAIVTMILLIVDLITILTNNFKDKSKKNITKWK